MLDLQKIAPLFEGWEETMIWSCLQGHMGRAFADDDETPVSAMILQGDVCFLAGAPNDALAANASAPEIVPQDESWHACIERVWGGGVQKRFRYAIRKEPGAFDAIRLEAFTRAIPEGFSLRLFDETACRLSAGQLWSKDFCALFDGTDDFLRRGLGVCAFRGGELVSGASSYCIYDGGIEIEIDTKPECRERGLATACGAALILECLRRGLYPSWDAYDLRSVALAEKLGYHLDHPYVMYEKPAEKEPPA